MWHVGIDLHRETIVMAAVNDAGEVIEPVRMSCHDREAIVQAFRDIGNFWAVIEASGIYRWLFELLCPLGTILLAHPLRLRAMIQRRSKTDKLDSQLLANLLRINQIPLAYVPPEPYQRFARPGALPRQAGTRSGRGENQAARPVGEKQHAIALHRAVRSARIGLVSRPKLRAGRQHAP